jgi:outer membrane protein assembly factor BamB
MKSMLCRAGVAIGAFVGMGMGWGFAADPVLVPGPEGAVAWLYCTLGPLPEAKTGTVALMTVGTRVERAVVSGLGMKVCQTEGLKVEGSRITGEMVVGFPDADGRRSLAAPLSRRMAVALDLAWDGARVSGTFSGKWAGRRNVATDAKGVVAGERVDEAGLRAANGLPDAATWSSYVGPNQNFSSGPVNGTVLEDLRQARMAWCSEYIGPPESGSKRYGACIGGVPAAGGASPLVMKGRVYQFRYQASGEAYQSAHVDKFLDASNGPATRVALEAVGWTEADLKRRWAISADEELICIDAASGRTLWTVRWPEEGLNFYDHKCSLTCFTGAAGNGRVYVIGGTGWVRALDAETGRQAWSVAVPGLAESLGKMKADALAKRSLDAPTRTFCKALTLAGDLVLAPDGYGACGVVALDAATGAVRWRSKPLLPNGTAVPLVVEAGGRRMALGVGNGVATAIDLADGKVVWVSDEVGQNENQCILVGDLLVAHAMKEPDRKNEALAFPNEKVQEWAPGAVLSAPGADFGQVGCWRVTTNGLERLWVTPKEWGAPCFTPVGTALGDLVCFRGKYAYQIVKIADGSRIASSYLSEPARMDEGHMMAMPGLFVPQPDSQHGDTKFYPFPARAGANVGPMWRPPHPTTTTYHIGMSHAWADGRLFMRGADAVYCYDLRTR